MVERPDPAAWDMPAMRTALAAHDFGTVYKMLQRRHGIAHQWRIGWLTGQSQPQVSATMAGRQIISYAVILRIANGLGIPPAYVGLACCPCPHTGGETTP